MNRVINPAKYLKDVVSEGKAYYIGFGIKDLTDLGKNLHGIDQLINGNQTTLLITGKKGLLKENTKGKFVRKKPEVKTSVWRNIDYYSKRFEKQINYDREFNVWEKEILHKYNYELELAKTPQGEIILHFPIFKMVDEQEHYMKVGAAMNLAIVLGSYYLIYDSKFLPILPITKFENKRILSSGTSSIEEKIEVIKEMLLSQGPGAKAEGNSYRFALLTEKVTSNITMGAGGFDEYLQFEYEHSDLMVLENLKSGNATYIFRLNKFNKNQALNKQNASKEASFLERVVHDNVQEWERKLSKYFKLPIVK